MKRIAFVLSALYFISCQQPAPKAGMAKDSALSVPDSATAVALVIDTVSIGGQLYDITQATQEEFNQLPEWQPDTSEAVNILHDSVHVRRAGDSLIFVLDNGQRKVMVNNNSDTEDYTQYTYQAFLSAMGNWMVFNAGYEWHSYELIDHRSGEMTRTIGIPAISPDQQRFICTNTDLMASFTLNGFQLFAIAKPFGKPVLVQEQELQNWGMSAIKWKDSKTLLALQHYLDKESNEFTRYIRLTPRP